MAQDPSEHDRIDDRPDEAEATVVNEGQDAPLSKRFVIACWSLLIVPTVLPLLFIPGVQNTNTMLMLGGLSAVLLVTNIVVLVVMIRWVKRVRADR
jgi:hypothetical protein